MAIERRLTDQGRERKQQLLDAAAELFATRGYGPTRVVDICQAAGVAKGLFYWYFDTKDALFAELVRSMRRQLRRSQATAMGSGGDALERLRLGTIASLHFIAQHSAYFALLDVGRSDDRVAPLLAEGGEVYSRDVEALLREAQAEGTVPADLDPHLAALGIVSTVGSYGQYVRTGRIDVDLDDLARFVSGWVVRAVSG